MVKMRSFLAVFHVELLSDVSRGTCVVFHVEHIVERELLSCTYCYNVMLTIGVLCEWGNENERIVTGKHC